MTRSDRDHLRTLSICHYVLGGLCFVIGCFPMIHLVIGIAIVTGAFPMQPQGNGNCAAIPGGAFRLVLHRHRECHNRLLLVARSRIGSGGNVSETAEVADLLSGRGRGRVPDATAWFGIGRVHLHRPIEAERARRI